MANYLDKKELFDEVVICRDKFMSAVAPLHLCVENPETIRRIKNAFGEERSGEFISDKLMTMLLLLVDRISSRHNYRGYSFREDMTASATLRLILGWWKFNPDTSSNPFSYYQTIIERVFWEYISTEKKGFAFRDDLIEAQGFEASHTRQRNNEEQGEQRKIRLEEQRDGLEKSSNYNDMEFKQMIKAKRKARKARQAYDNRFPSKL